MLRKNMLARGAARRFSTARRNGLKLPNIAIAGASGAVGIEMLKTIEKRQFPFNTVRDLGTPRARAPTMQAVRAPRADG